MASMLLPANKRFFEFEISNSSDVTARLSDRFLVDAESQKGKWKVVVKLGTTGESFARSELKNTTIVTMKQDPVCALEVAQKKADVWIYDQLSIFRHHKRHKDTTKALLKLKGNTPQCQCRYLILHYRYVG